MSRTSLMTITLALLTSAAPALAQELTTIAPEAAGATRPDVETPPSSRFLGFEVSGLRSPGLTIREPETPQPRNRSTSELRNLGTSKPRLGETITCDYLEGASVHRNSCGGA